MDFIERLLSISPDGGSGAMELALFAIPIIGMVVLAAARWARGQRGARGESTSGG